MTIAYIQLIIYNENSKRIDTETKITVKTLVHGFLEP